MNKLFKSLAIIVAILFLYTLYAVKTLLTYYGKELPTANYKVINLEEFIETEIKIYD